MPCKPNYKLPENINIFTEQLMLRITSIEKEVYMCSNDYQN